ncbi:efflux RND transporter periplasmic adaptor subunit [Actinokineospora auranticolor]|uniref:Macrolide-specific efflux system membrane fusion protein n=1 Tax=Actinokineospora auranticolor TaxID=155976 RepID=A0A2S6GI21_9PSEU|nr:efflux RND transporter periplasmic adaptor subunit [Actinokineospora auranticolor]PPK64882.1 macrolide-specific efflux system membrane fusion protein [Actinokineospora auranticolor]
MRRGLVVNGILAVVLVGAAVAGYFVLFGGGTETAAAAQTRTAAAQTRDVSETVTAAGTVASGYTGTASFGTSGTVAAVNVKVGDVVTKGQTLGTLETSEPKLQLTIAQNNLNQAVTNRGDAEAAGKDTDQLDNQVNQAVLARDQAKAALAATTLTAPGDGTITSVGVTVGAKAGSGGGGSSSTTTTTASGDFVITDLKNLTLHADVAESDVSKLKVGQAATVTVNALPNQPIQAAVAAVDLLPTSSNNVVQYGTTLTMTSPPATLKPGQSASVSITVASATGALAVPSAAVQTVGTTSTVTVLENGQETRRTVEVGVRGDSYAQITSGLSENEQVVLPQVATGTTQQGNNNRNGNGGFGGGGFGGGGGGVPAGGRTGGGR